MMKKKKKSLTRINFSTEEKLRAKIIAEMNEITICMRIKNKVIILTEEPAVLFIVI